MINYDDYEDDETPSFERIRKDNNAANEPVSGRHDIQRRAENGRNRFIKTARRQKEKDRNS
jgi:hypothetical protein